MGIISFKTAIIGTVLGGALITGVAWTGGGSVLDGISLIKDQDTQLETFKANESKLVSQLNKTTTAVQSLQTEIAAKNKQIADLIEAGGDNAAKILELQDQVADLTAQLATKTAELEAINEAMAGKTDEDLTSDANAILKEIDRLQAEINEANTDAALLQDAINDAGDVPTADTNAVNEAIEAAEIAIGEVPDPIQPDPVKENPNNYPVYQMLTGSPKVINSYLTAKVENGSLVFVNKGDKYTAIINGVSHTIKASGETVIDSVSSLDKSEMILKDKDGDALYDGTNETGKFWLTNQ